MVLAEDGKSLREPRADEVISVLDSMAFFSRLTDDEYEALTKTKSVKLLRWLERVRTRGYIEVNGRTMKEAKEELSAAGVSASRVAELFAR
jgi:transcription initiation factor IIE alpha subunit